MYSEDLEEDGRGLNPDPSAKVVRVSNLGEGEKLSGLADVM